MTDVNSKKFYYSTQILEHYLDFFGHVNHSYYLNILEEARWDMLTQNNYGLSRILQEKIAPVVLEVNIKYKLELKNRETIKIETFVSKIINKYLAIITQNIYKNNSDLSCTACFKFGLMDLEKRKLVSSFSDWEKAIGIN